MFLNKFYEKKIELDNEESWFRNCIAIAGNK